MAPRYEKTKELPKKMAQWKRLAKQWGSQGAIKDMGSTLAEPFKRRTLSLQPGSTATWVCHYPILHAIGA